MGIYKAEVGAQKLKVDNLMSIYGNKLDENSDEKHK